MLTTTQGAVPPDPRSIAAEAMKPVVAKLDEFKGLVGDWEGEGPSGKYDEHWLPSNGGSMMGLFCFIAGGQLRSTSVLNLRQQGENIEMLLRGLSPGLTSTKDQPDTMVLVKFTKDTARFVNRFEGALPKALIVTHPKGGLRVVVESLKGTQPSRTELNFRRTQKR